MIKLEICTASVQSCIEAEKAGAIRVEFCDNLMEGGTTPALSQIELAKELIKIDLNVIIRPRGGDFYYSDIEFETMKRDIHHCGKAKVTGVVFGILDRDGNVDMPRNKELMDIAKQYGLSTTFHRAIDRASNILEAMEDCIKLGFDRILTSGGKKTVMIGKDVLKEMAEKAAGRIIIMPGSGLNEDNIAELVQHIGLQELHGTFRSRYTGEMKYVMDNELGSFDDEYTYMQADADKIKKAIVNATKALS